MDPTHRNDQLTDNNNQSNAHRVGLIDERVNDYLFTHTRMYIPTLWSLIATFVRLRRSKRLPDQT